MENGAGRPRRRDRDWHSLWVSLREMEHMTAGVAPVVIHVGAGAWAGQETGRVLTLRTGGLVHGAERSGSSPAAAVPDRTPAKGAYRRLGYRLAAAGVLGHLPGIGAELLALLPGLACRWPALLANALDVWFRQRRYAFSGTLLRRNFVCRGWACPSLSIVLTWSWSVPCGLEAGLSASFAVDVCGFVCPSWPAAVAFLSPGAPADPYWSVPCPPPSLHPPSERSSGLHPLITTSKSAESTTLITIEPRQPKRFEKNTNIDDLSKPRQLTHGLASDYSLCGAQELCRGQLSGTDALHCQSGRRSIRTAIRVRTRPWLRSLRST